MKQLKVVVNDNPSNLLTQAGGYVTANFIINLTLHLKILHRILDLLLKQ